MLLDISKIKIDGGTQSRERLDESVVADYAEAIDSLPPVVVFFDGSDHWLADGFHRYHAHRSAGRNAIESDIRSGARRDAVIYSVGANRDHGLRRSNSDKRRAVKTLLADSEWSKWSDRKIAEACGVSHPFVAAIRAPEAASRQAENRAVSETKKVAKQVARGEISLPEAAKQIAPAKSEAKTKPKKGEPTIESLQTENAQLREALVEARDNARELAAMVESYDAVTQGEHAAAKEMTKLRAQLRTVEATRDQWMTTAGELRKEVKALQRKQGVRQ